MHHTIRTINAGANCYLIHIRDGYIMIDSGFSTKRATLEQELANAGCKRGDLRLVILTHGDPDHSGNALFLREKYGAKIALHPADYGMVEKGDMDWNRKAKPDRISPVMKLLNVILPYLSQMPAFEKFIPDIAIDEQFNLSEYGFDAKVLLLPGHSKGSIGVLTNEGEFFCGDLQYNLPGFYYCDDAVDYETSLGRIKKAKIKIVYPGHGKPFPLEKMIKGYHYPAGA